MRVNKWPQVPQDVEKLKEALLEEWDKIDIDTIDHLIDSMPDHVKAVLDAKGGSTRY
jgi:hypothetical protein